MGFPVEACRKAVYHTKNAGIETAMNWVMEHMDDPGRSMSDDQGQWSSCIIDEEAGYLVSIVCHFPLSFGETLLHRVHETFRGSVFCDALNVKFML